LVVESAAINFAADTVGSSGEQQRTERPVLLNTATAVHSTVITLLHDPQCRHHCTPNAMEYWWNHAMHPSNHLQRIM